MQNAEWILFDDSVITTSKVNQIEQERKTTVLVNRRYVGCSGSCSDFVSFDSDSARLQDRRHRSNRTIPYESNESNYSPWNHSSSERTFHGLRAQSTRSDWLLQELPHSKLPIGRVACLLHCEYTTQSLAQQACDHKVLASCFDLSFSPRNLRNNALRVLRNNACSFTQQNRA